MRKHVLAKRLTWSIMAASLSVAFAAAGSAEAAVAHMGDENVVVTASAIPTLIENTPANMTVITAQEIAEKHFTTVGEALEGVNGVTVTKLGGGNQELVRLNGDDRVIIMLDGQRLNNDQGAGSGRAGVDAAMFPMLDNIARIEVVKGGASALYGSDAVGGVINIITKQAKTNATALDVSYGSWGTHNYNISNEGANGKFSWQVAAGLSGRNDFKYKFQGSDYTMNNSGTDNNSVYLKLNQKVSDNSSWQVGFMHKTVDAKQYQCKGDNSAAYTFYNGYMKEVFNNTNVTYRFKENSATPGFVRYFYNNKAETYGNKFGTEMQGIDYQNGWSFGDHDVVAGFEWHRSKSSNSANGYADAKITNTAVYLQDSWMLGEKWTVVPGVRMDKHESFGTHWTPKLAVNYLASDATKVFASYGRVFKAPTADDLYYYTHEDYGAWGITDMIGNKDLKPESGWTASFGVAQKLGTKSDMTATMFSSEISDAIKWPATYDAGTNTTTYIPENMNREKRSGIELTFNTKVDNNWSYSLGYSYISSELNGKYDNGNMMPNGFKADLKFRNKQLKASLQGTIGSGVDETVYVNRGYNLWNLNVSYDFTDKITGYVKAMNLTNSEFYTYKTSYGTYYPAAGRSFMVGMNVKF